jgi:hypothetical protein
MADSAASMARPDRGVLSWRTPPAQTAALFLVVTLLCAVNIYVTPSGFIRVLTIALAIASFAWAVVGMRMFLLVDDEGIVVRYIGRSRSMAWSEIRDVDVVAGVRGAHTVRITTVDGTHVDVPPSLLQPAKPTMKPVAIAALKAVAARIQERRTSA